MEETNSVRRGRALQPLSGQPPDERPRRATLREKLEARWHESRLARSTSRAPKTPAVRPKVRFRDGDVEAFRHLAHSVISRTLAHENEYRRTGYPPLEQRDWKLLKQQNGLRVYKSKIQQRFDPSVSQDIGFARQLTALCIGRVDGSLEDVLYGMHCKTRKEMHVTDTFLKKCQVDCAVLSVIDRGFDRDPFRQLALKWTIVQTGDPRVGDYRELCTLESMGIGVDGNGERYGYRLIKSLDLAEYSHLATRHDAVHIKVTMCSIFRQDWNSHDVRVYAKGMVDTGDNSPSTSATCSMLVSIANATEVAEAKRLTLLALQHAEYVACSSFRPQVQVSQLLDLSRETESTIASPLSTAAHSATDLRGPFSQKMSSTPCYVCGKKPRMSRIVGITYLNCGVCSQRVCHKCHVKRRLFARADTVTVTCCKVCIIASKRLHVDPRDPCPMLHVR